MSSRRSADHFYASIGMERPRVSPGEKASITMIVTKVMSFLEKTGRGPYTLLLPDGDQLDSIQVDSGHLNQAQLDGLTGWFLDLVLFGDALSRSDPSVGSGCNQQLSTVAGSSLVFTRENDKLVVADPWGVRAFVSDPLFNTPAVTVHSVDALLMWTAWSDLILPQGATGA